jgi:hypothetical protein
MVSMVAQIRSHISASSVAFPSSPLLLSLSIASSAGTRRQAGGELWLNSLDHDGLFLFHQLRENTLLFQVDFISLSLL